jgi:hypothetical protein
MSVFGDLIFGDEVHNQFFKKNHAKIEKNLKPAGRKRVVLTGRSNGRSEILDRTRPGLAGPAGYRYRLQLWIVDVEHKVSQIVGDVFSTFNRKENST